MLKLWDRRALSFECHELEKKNKRKCHENDEGQTVWIAFVLSKILHDVALVEGTFPSSDKASAASFSQVQDTEASDEKTSAASGVVTRNPGVIILLGLQNAPEGPPLSFWHL